MAGAGTTWGTPILALSLVAAAACHDRDRGAAPNDTASVAPAADPKLGEPADAMGQRLREAARTTAGHLPVGTYFRDRLARNEQRDYLVVLKGVHCYRIVAVGDPAVEDLDLVLYDPAGVRWRQDLTQDANPVLGADAEVCPPQSGAYRLHVQMTAGHGEFLVGVYRSP